MSFAHSFRQGAMRSLIQLTKLLGAVAAAVTAIVTCIQLLRGLRTPEPPPKVPTGPVVSGPSASGPVSAEAPASATSPADPSRTDETQVLRQGDLDLPLRTAHGLVPSQDDPIQGRQPLSSPPQGIPGALHVAQVLKAIEETPVTGDTRGDHEMRIQDAERLLRLASYLELQLPILKGALSASPSEEIHRAIAAGEQVGVYKQRLEQLKGR